VSNATQTVIGPIVSLRRYPVKSMAGEELNLARVTARGLVGDRAYALVDNSTGKVASAKNPRKWSTLFDYFAAFVEPLGTGDDTPPVRITLPSGETVSSQQSTVNKILSSALGREVTLMSSAPDSPSLEEYWPDIDGLPNRETVTDESMALGAPPGTFFDFAPVHLVTSATIDRLREVLPQGRFEVRRFRPNIVVEVSSGVKDFVENAWVGHSLRIGDEVCLSVVIPCPRCVMTTLPQSDLPADPGILRAAAQHNRVNIAPLGQALPSVGVYATVVRGGTIRRGDSVVVE